MPQNIPSKLACVAGGVPDVSKARGRKKAARREKNGEESS